MTLKKNIITLMLLIGFAVSGFAQDVKIGYANIELILVYMPETKTMNQQLATYEKKLAEDLQSRQTYAQTKLEEYQEFIQSTPPPTEDQVKGRQDELLKLDEEIRKKQAEAQQKLATRRQDYMEPIAEKLQGKIL